MTPCNGKTALVTGASRGIGRAAALALAKSGAQVLVHYGRGAKEAKAVVDEIRAAGGKAEAVGADLSAPTVGFDMTAILDDPIVRTPALFYLFHRVEERLDGNPTIIVVDEGWKALDDDVFVRRIKDWEKTIRKRNGIVGFATQSAATYRHFKLSIEANHGAAETQLAAVATSAERVLYTAVGAVAAAADAVKHTALTLTNPERRARQLDQFERRGARTLDRSRRKVRSRAH